MQSATPPQDRCSSTNLRGPSLQRVSGNPLLQGREHSPHAPGDARTIESGIGKDIAAAATDGMCCRRCACPQNAQSLSVSATRMPALNM
jgi:hypothetical protein